MGYPGRCLVTRVGSASRSVGGTEVSARETLIVPAACLSNYMVVVLCVARPVSDSNTGEGILLLLSSGAGTETCIAIDTVILAGVLAATASTLFVAPVAYDLLARRTGSPGDVQRQVEAEAG
jgi:hypothetical protein